MTVSDLNESGHELTDGEYQNLYDLCERMNKLEKDCPYEFIVTSGHRTEADQMRINPKNPKSAHRLGCAVDIADYNFEIWYWLEDNINLVRKLGLYLENAEFTPTHVHIQSIPPKSGNIIFNP